MSFNSQLSWHNLTANGNVQPCRVIVGVTGAGNALLAIQAATTGTLPPLGISREQTRYVPGSPADDGFVAVAGEPLAAYGPGEIGHCQAGAAITDASMPLTYDNTGRVITAVTGSGTPKWCIGFPRNTALAANDKVEVIITYPFLGPV